MVCYGSAGDGGGDGDGDGVYAIASAGGGRHHDGDGCRGSTATLQSIVENSSLKRVQSVDRLFRCSVFTWNTLRS